MVFLTGSGPPANSTGTIGDVYVDTTSNLYYGPKQTPLEWPPTSINFAAAMLRHGAGTPSVTFGNIDEFYLDYVNMVIYGPKTSGGWGQGSFLWKTGMQIPSCQDQVTMNRDSYCSCQHDAPCETVFNFDCQSNFLNSMFCNINNVTVMRIAVLIIIILLIIMILKK